MRTRKVQADDGTWVTVNVADSFNVKTCGDKGCRNAHVLLKDETGACFAELTLSLEQADAIAGFAEAIAAHKQVLEMCNRTLQ